MSGESGWVVGEGTGTGLGHGRRRPAAQIEAAPTDPTERISVGSDAVTLGDLRISAQGGLAPVAGPGRVIIGGSWQ